MVINDKKRNCYRGSIHFKEAAFIGTDVRGRCPHPIPVKISQEIDFMFVGTTLPNDWIRCFRWEASIYFRREGCGSSGEK